MAEPTILTPIELTDADLDAVSGGRSFVGVRQSNSNRTRQSIHQSITETGGSVTIGGSGATANSAPVSLSETFSATETASNSNSSTQSTTNSGNVTGAI